MKKLTNLSAVALFAIFLTACDKPASQTASQANATQSVEAPKADTGAQDYKTFREWQHAQEKAINEAISSAIEKLGEKAKDQKLVQETMNSTLLAQIDAIQKSAETLVLQDPQVKALKDKSLEAIALGAQMMVEGDKVEKNPSEEAHKAFSELQAKLEKIAVEGKALEEELVKKYEPARLAPQAEQAPAQPQTEAPKAQ